MAGNDPGGVAHRIMDTVLYMVLATADVSGRPWASPVYFAHAGYAELFWVSSPEATHSRNIAVRPEVSIVVFDSRVPVGTGQGVYMTAVAAETSGEELERGIEIFSRRSLETGGQAWTAEDVQGTTGLRLYRAVASEHSILAKDGAPDHRVVVDLP
jgi:nitroimidazol reductase NimA-like FMN-containing flavoprotein (pyridoxamine 5'-phosphate oxidase superfamily)